MTKCQFLVADLLRRQVAVIVAGEGIVQAVRRRARASSHRALVIERLTHRVSDVGACPRQTAVAGIVVMLVPVPAMLVWMRLV